MRSFLESRVFVGCRSHCDKLALLPALLRISLGLYFFFILILTDVVRCHDLPGNAARVLWHAAAAVQKDEVEVVHHSSQDVLGEANGLVQRDYEYMEEKKNAGPENLEQAE